jgi:hypothetical protein
MQMDSSWTAGQYLIFSTRASFGVACDDFHEILLANPFLFFVDWTVIDSVHGLAYYIRRATTRLHF